jgi:hypothetical protein
MDAFRLLEGYLSELGNEIAVRLKLEQDGHCIFSCKDGSDCDIAAVGNDFFVFTSIMAQRPAVDVERLYEHALRLNDDLAVTRGATLALAAGDTIKLQLIGDANEFDYSKFKKTVGDFVLASHAVRASFADLVKTGGAERTQAPKPSDADLSASLDQIVLRA